MRKPIILLSLFLLSFYVVIGFLTFNLLKNTEKTARYNQLQEKVRDSEKIIRLIEGQLEQSQNQLSAVSQFLDKTSPESLRQLIDKTPIIQSIFVMRRRQLIYPRLTGPATEREQQLIRLITPLVNDPSLLLQHSKATEGDKQQSGWYNLLTTHSPTLIYWQQSDDYLLGYVLSYAVFRANLIVNADKIQVAGQYELFDNGQLLLSNRSQKNRLSSDDLPADNQSIKVIRSLDYPLQHWTVDYVLPPPHIHYGTTILSALAVALVITWLTLMLYRYIQRRMRLAAQQVQFVGQVSHELKTPLTNIRLYADLLAEQAQDSPQSVRYATVIRDESQRLTRLIQNVLNFSKSSTARIEPVLLEALLNRLVQIFTPVLQAKNLSIRLHNQCPIDTVIHSDNDMLMQILSNFISNAEKYAADGQYIDVEAAIDDKHCLISVRDYGKGIAKNEIKHILKPFYRIHNHLTEGVSGTGIGLTIAKQLADTLGAVLIIERSQPGMRFGLRLNLPE